MFIFFFMIQSPCESSPCQNSGTCIPDYEGNSYSCNCPSHVTGQHCETRKYGLVLRMLWKLLVWSDSVHFSSHFSTFNLSNIGTIFMTVNLKRRQRISSLTKPRKKETWHIQLWITFDFLLGVTLTNSRSGWAVLSPSVLMLSPLKVLSLWSRTYRVYSQ